MNTQPGNLESRIRSMRIVWIGILSSLGVYFVFTLVRGRPPDNVPNLNLSLILLGIGVLTTLASFVIKNILITKAVEQRQVALVQQAYIVTWAVAEVAGLLGLMDYFTTSNPYYYALFVIAALGMLLHFPRREPVERAALKPGLS